jgi:hypothetical protein
LELPPNGILAKSATTPDLGVVPKIRSESLHNIAATDRFVKEKAMFRSLILAAALTVFAPLVTNVATAGEITLLPSIKLQIGDRDNYGNYWDGGRWRDRDYWGRHYEWRDNRWRPHDRGYHRGWDKRNAYERGYREGWRDRDDHRGPGRGPGRGHGYGHHH